MYKFTKDKKRCVSCGNCTIYGREYLKTNNIYELFMDNDFIVENKKEIDLVLERCYLEALSLIEYKENDYGEKL